MTARMTEHRPGTADPASSPAAAFQAVIASALEVAAARMSEKADDWTDRLDDVAGGRPTRSHPSSVT